MFFIGQAASRAGDRGKERAKFHAALGLRCPLQDGADFSLGATAMLGGLDSDGPMHFIGKISYIYVYHLVYIHKYISMKKLHSNDTKYQAFSCSMVRLGAKK